MTTPPTPGEQPFHEPAPAPAPAPPAPGPAGVHGVWDEVPPAPQLPPQPGTYQDARYQQDGAQDVGYPQDAGYQPPGYYAPTSASPFQQGPGGYPLVPRRWNNYAIAALVLGIAGLGTLLPSVAAIICGHVALAQIRRAPNERGRGLAIAGIVLGWTAIALVVAGFVLLVLFFALVSQGV